jgi:pyrroloquinoline quinone biosynthesis protein D
MSARVIVNDDSVPRLGPHMRLRHDRARESWTIQAPERTFMLDPIAHAIVSSCDGERTIAAIVESLCARHPDAPREVIEGDVVKLVQDFVDKGVMAA